VRAGLQKARQAVHATGEQPADLPMVQQAVHHRGEVASVLFICVQAAVQLERSATRKCDADEGVRGLRQYVRNQVQRQAILHIQLQRAKR